MTRRRFLAVLAGLVGLGGTTAWAIASNQGGEVAADAVASGGASNPALGSSTTVPSTRPTGTTNSPTTAAAPTTSTAPTTTTTPPSTTTSTSTPPTTATPVPPTSTTSTTATTTTTTIVSTGAGIVQAICKSAWGGREPSGALTNHTIERMTVHHTAALLDSNRSAPGRARAHQSLHMDDRGWVDLAYHFLVDANGHVYEGRPISAVGDTATNYDPAGHFLVLSLIHI